MFDLKIEDQGHEEQCSVLCHYMTNSVVYNFAEKNMGLPFVCGSSSNPTIIHYIWYTMIKMENVHMTLQISIRSQIWNTKITKAHNGHQADKK